MSKKKNLCPFCLCEFEKTPYLCLNKNCKGKKEKNFLYPKIRLFNAPNNAKCPKCGNVSYNSVCPNCLRPYSENKAKFIVPILGNRGAGKSTYYGVMIHEMLKKIAPSFNGSFEGFYDSLSRYQWIYQDYLYKGVPVNSFYFPNEHIVFPMVFDYKWRERKKFFNIQTVIYDYSEGVMLINEDLNQFDVLFSNVSGILFVIDPLSFKSVVDQVELQTNLNRYIADNYGDGELYISKILSNVTKIIRKANKTEEYKKIDIPLAVVLLKYDIFDNLIPEYCTVKLPSPHCKSGRFDDNDRRAVNDEIASLLDGWGGSSFTSQLENNYKIYSYFAVSSLGIGNSPKNNGTFEIPHPHRIEDPILWLMKENRIIK